MVMLAEYGTPDQKKRYLSKILAGESVITVGTTGVERTSARSAQSRGPRTMPVSASAAKPASFAWGMSGVTWGAFTATPIAVAASPAKINAFT